jgi:hypothetical protein
LKSAELVFVVPITGADQVTPSSSEWLTITYSRPFAVVTVARLA